MIDSLQKQQGEIDALKDIIKEKSDEPLAWDIGAEEINVCDLSVHDDTFAHFIWSWSGIPSLLGSIGYAAASWVTSSPVIRTGAGVLTAAIGLMVSTFYQNRVLRRELVYKVSKKVYCPEKSEDTPENDLRPSYDQARDLVDGSVYECKPLIRTLTMTGKTLYSSLIMINDPDRIALEHCGVFRKSGPLTCSGVTQLISSSMTQEVLTRRTLPEVASGRVRRILATHDRICGSTETLLSTGRSDFRDTANMCEMIVSRSLPLNSKGSNKEKSFSVTGLATFLSFSLTLLLSLGLTWVLFTGGPNWIERQLLQPCRGMWNVVCCQSLTLSALSTCYQDVRNDLLLCLLS